MLAGCTFRESLLCVQIDGGVSGNVVPDEVSLTIGHRFAPDRTASEAEIWLREWLEPFLEDGDRADLVDAADAAWPATDHRLIADLVERNRLTVSAKLGWTDVARFSAHGVPAANFGPGDATLAHTAEERVTGESLGRVWAAIDDLVRSTS